MAATHNIFTCLVVISILLQFTKDDVLALNDSRDLILTSREKNALEKFRQSVDKILVERFMKSDFYLIRWLRQADLDIPTARSNLIRTINWRRNNNMSSILSEDFSDLEEDYHMSFEGHDRQGRPLLFINLGEWDLRAAVIQGKIQRLRRYLTYSTEKSTRLIFKAQQETGKPVTRLVVLVDADGVNLRQHTCPMCLSFLVQWTIDKEMHYPSFTDETIIINAPTVGAIVLNAVRAVMSSELNSQTRAFDQNREVWMSYLDQRIDRKERTRQYGGTKKTVTK